MNLEDEIAQGLSKQIAQEIDFELLTDVLIACGWTKIVLPSKWLPVSGVGIHEWREKNLTGKYKAHENVWLFEKSEDAVVFSLRWL